MVSTATNEENEEKFALARIKMCVKVSEIARNITKIV
jgi:hypothetical protein